MTRETKTKVETPSEAATWAARAAPPPARLSLDLSPWRPSSGAAEAWTIPVPSPFRIEGKGHDQMLRGTPGVPGELLRPVEAPWMYGDFADVARRDEKMDGGPEDGGWYRSVDPGPAAVQFADRYGLPTQWEDDGSGGLRPPEAQPLRDFLDTASLLLTVLRRWKAGPQGGERTAGFLRLYINGVVKDLSLEPVRNDDGSWALITRWDRPLSLRQVMELQTVSDLLDGREVKECGFCGKLFVWTEVPGRQREVRSDARFCSALHARALAQRNRRREGAKEILSRPRPNPST